MFFGVYLSVGSAEGGGGVGGFIYMLSRVLAVVIGIYFFLRKRSLPCNGAFIVLSTVYTDGVVTV